jgi:signal transduction histidine kinase
MSIRVKIFGYLLLFCSVLISLLWLFQVVLLDAVYKRIKIGEVSVAMNAIASNLDNDKLSEIADGIYQTLGVNICILSSDGSVSYTAGELFRQKDSSQQLSRLYLLARENGGEYFEYPFSSVETNMPRPNDGRPFGAPRGVQDIHHCKIVSRASGNDTLIILSAMISPVDATVGTLKIELYFITGVMLLFAIGLAVLISRRISKPIVIISKSAKRLAQGRYDVAFDEKGYREIKELAETLNIAARELSAVDELRKELMANISHDLRTPLTLIAGYAEAMRDLPGEATPENAQVIVDEAKRLNRLVSEVLDLSKLQSGAVAINPAPYNLSHSLRGIVERLSEFTKANGYSIILEADEDITVTADERLISQALYNLLTNSINFTGEDKTVTVRQIAAAEAVTIEIADTGKGVSAEEAPYIWDRYYRTGKKHKRAVIGSGIGLSIVKSAMDLHGGEYGVKPATGGGSVFWIKLGRKISK